MKRRPATGAITSISRPLTLVAIALAMGACATSSEPVTRSGPAGTRPANSPLAPIATPVPDDASLQSRVQVGVTPLGSVPYDGATLPLTAPNGRYLVTQIGTPPPWDAVLATDQGTTPIRSGLAVFRVEPGELVLLHRTDQAGVLLGRSCTDRGYLVEQPRPDGSRRIGLVPWELSPDRVRWLVDDGRYNAHATLVERAGSTDAIIYCRRPTQEPGLRELVLLVPGRPPISHQAAPGTEFRFPIVSAGGASGLSRRGAWVGAIQHGAGQTRLVSFRTDQGGLDPVGGITLVSARDGASPVHGYQATASIVTPGSQSPNQMLLIHPSEGRLITLVGDRFGRVWRWTKRSFAGATVPGRAGLMVGTPNGLRFQPSPEMDGGRAGDVSVSVLAGQQIPRLTDQAPDFDYLLLGAPEEGGGNSLEILRLRVLQSAR